MSEWIKSEDEGMECWINEDLGNVVKIGEEMFVAFYPKIIKIGPFSSESEAQSYLEQKKEEIDSYLDGYNIQFLSNEK